MVATSSYESITAQTWGNLFGLVVCLPQPRARLFVFAACFPGGFPRPRFCRKPTSVSPLKCLRELPVDCSLSQLSSATVNSVTEEQVIRHRGV